jgi:hypothetical protein
MSFRAVGFLALFLAFCAPAHASCGEYLGQELASQRFAQAVAPFARISPKDEYENTADYEARVNKAVRGYETLFISSTLAWPSSLRYNADKGELEITGLALLGAKGFNPSALTGTPAQALGRGQNLNAVIESERVSLGSYRATNAFGVTADVFKGKQLSNVIFDGNYSGVSRTVDVFKAGFRTEVVGTIPLSAAEARRLKPLLQMIWVVSPQPPYLVTARSRSRPTINDRSDIEQIDTVLLADIQCALITDDRRKVLAIIETN